MKENNEDIKQKFKLGIAISQIKSDENKKKFSKKVFNIKKYGLVACVCIMFITGTVFAKDIGKIIKDKFGLGKGVQTAVDNGYIEKNEKDSTIQTVEIYQNNEKIANINMKCNVSEFLITDKNLSINFSFEIENEINEYVELGKVKNGNIDYEGSYILELSDLFIIDENNEILYLNKSNDNAVKEFFNKNGLNYDLSELDKFSNNANINNFYDKDNMLGFNLTCNFVSSNDYPKSKQLKLYFTEITLTEPFFNENEAKKITLKGNWNFTLDVPEIMYNRTNISYRVIECEREDINVYEAKLTDTGFELGLKLLNTEKPIYPEELLKREKELNANENMNRKNSSWQGKLY